ncbi:hypothetical protein CRUP_029772, partial [Coryphaenoides rupestris]
MASNAATMGNLPSGNGICNTIPDILYLPELVFGGLVWILVACTLVVPANPQGWVMFVSVFCFVMTFIWMVFGGLVWILVACTLVVPANPQGWVMFVSVFCFVMTFIWMVFSYVATLLYFVHTILSAVFSYVATLLYFVHTILSA